jgi:hypothetical protein
MDRVRQFLEDVKKRGLAEGHFLGLLNVVIGRHIRRADGTPVSRGITWRELAAQLKKVRWDRDAVRQLGIAPSALPPRDREKYWYAAIVQARVDSPDATQDGDCLAESLRKAGYDVGPAPGAPPPAR